MVTVISWHSAVLAALCQKPPRSLSVRFTVSSFSPAPDAFPSPFLLPTGYIYPLPYSSIRGLMPNHLSTAKANRACTSLFASQWGGVKRSAPSADSHLLLPPYLNSLRNNHAHRSPNWSHHTRYNLPMLLVPQSGSHIVGQTATRRPPMLQMAKKNVVMATGSC